MKMHYCRNKKDGTRKHRRKLFVTHSIERRYESNTYFLRLIGLIDYGANRKSLRAKAIPTRSSAVCYSKLSAKCFYLQILLNRSIIVLVTTKIERDELKIVYSDQ